MHPRDVHGLPLRVLLPHVDDTGKIEQRTCRRCGHSVLSGARLRDDPALAETLGEQHLPDGVVDLVRPRVREVLTLQEDPVSGFPREVRGVGEWCWAADVVAKQ